MVPNLTPVKIVQTEQTEYMLVSFVAALYEFTLKIYNYHMCANFHWLVYSGSPYMLALSEWTLNSHFYMTR